MTTIRGLLANRHGFSLAELLVVMAITGVAATAILTLYLNTQRSAVTSEEVVEVQQNIRLASERIARDLRMAGFMVPKQTSAISTGANATTLPLVTASATGIAARLDADVDVVVAAGAQDVDVVVAYPEMVDLFKDGDVVRILRTPNQEEPFLGTFVVENVDRDANQLTINGFAATLPAPAGTTVSYQPGDVMVRTTASAPNPNTVRYCLGPVSSCGPSATCSSGGQTCLMRVVNGTADVVASNIAPGGLQFSYLLGSGAETPTPTNEELMDIKAVRVTITGQTATSVHLSEGVPKVRSMTSVTSLRNR